MDAETRAPAGTSAPDLRESIINRTAVVGVVGLGYVGLPVLVAAGREGFPIIGIDVDHEKIESLRDGRSYIGDVTDADIAALDHPFFAQDVGALREADVVIISAPTPLKDGVPDLSPVRRAAEDVASVLRPGQLVVLESTTYPGTTEELIRPILETSGLEVGGTVFLAYSPERINPGTDRPFRDTPKIVSGVGPRDTELALLFYEQLVDQVVVTPTPREAEMAKLIENTFRQVNIALVNELAMLSPDLGVDIWAAIEAAATKPFGFQPFWPGPGVGGHCIAVDPSYLSWRVDQRFGFGIRFVEHARSINNRMPAYIVGRIAEALNEVGKPLRGSKIMGIGLAYKADVDDIRESPAIAVMERLASAGAICSYHDPYIPAAALLGGEFASRALEPEILQPQDCVVILTAHEVVNYEAIVAHARLVFDARGVTRRLAHTPNVVRL